MGREVGGGYRAQGRSDLMIQQGEEQRSLPAPILRVNYMQGCRGEEQPKMPAPQLLVQGAREQTISNGTPWSNAEKKFYHLKRGEQKTSHLLKIQEANKKTLEIAFLIQGSD